MPTTRIVKGHGKVHKGYTKNYLDRNKLYGMAIWLREAKLNVNPKNIDALMKIQSAVNIQIEAMAKGK